MRDAMLDLLEASIALMSEELCILVIALADRLSPGASAAERKVREGLHSGRRATWPTWTALRAAECHFLAFRSGCVKLLEKPTQNVEETYVSPKERAGRSPVRSVTACGTGRREAGHAGDQPRYAPVGAAEGLGRARRDRL